MRCVNIDWLEVYCEESNDEYPCNAEYFRKRGYQVEEREYGTRVYAEMFFILDNSGERVIEVRRNPKSGDSSFTGLSEFSTHIRLTNWVCYRDNCVSFLREFLVRHNYIFHRIFRIDICYDFTKFDSGDKPERVARRIIEKTYLKMNQGRIAVFGADNWATYDWETLSWGSPSSMVTTKMYNKTKEIAAMGNKKPYIITQWMIAGLIDNPISMTKRMPDGSLQKTDVWRIEFSIKSKADSWLVLEDISGKKMKKKAVPHHLSLFDSRDKLWQRFQDLAYHYFRFKILSYKGVKRGVASNALNVIQSVHDRELQRKDRMPEKVLFYFNRDREFLHVQAVPKPSKPDNQAEILRRRLVNFSQTHPDPKIREACSVIIDTIGTRDLYRYTPDFDIWKVKALQAAIKLKLGGDERSTVELVAELEHLLKNGEIF